MSMTVRFNTKRLYTSEGQKITAFIHDDGTVDFNDHSRMIDGRLRDKLPRIVPGDEGILARWIMDRYDTGKYDGHLSYKDRDPVKYDPDATFAPEPL